MASVDKCGYNETTKAWSYILMNIIIGILLTIIFIQLGTLSLIPYFFYDCLGNKETNNIQMIIYDKNNNMKNADITKNFKIINNEGNYFVIESERYKKIKDTVINLLNMDMEIIEIAGQTEIQMRILINDQTKQFDYIDKLYEINSNQKNKKELLVNINVVNLKKIVNDDCTILHIYDY